jgi:hypothetical protein
MTPGTDATPNIYALNHLLRVPFAEVRAATDLVKDPWGGFIEVLNKANPQAATTSSTAAKQDRSPLHADLPDVGPRLANMNPWLIDTMSIIDAHRKNLLSGSRTVGSRPALDSAEMLASFISDISPRRRPQLNIESDGRPTFATATDDFYIHLTVDAPNRLTWYAVVRGAEHFHEGVAFDGRKLPQGLAQLFSL